MLFFAGHWDLSGIKEQLRTPDKISENILWTFVIERHKNEEK